jgi:DNA-binding CsgD family transcriptional regulator
LGFYLKNRDNNGIFHHFLVSLDSNFEILQTACNKKEVTLPPDICGYEKKCYTCLWMLESPCAECPIKELMKERQNQPRIISHFKQGISSLTSEMVTASAIVFPGGPLKALVLLEPLMTIIEDEKKNLFAYDYSHGGNGEGENMKMEEYLSSLFYKQKYTHLLAGFNLSPTELMVANYVLRGITSKEIAFRMSISKKSVDFHRSNIRKKLGITGEKTSIPAYLMQLSGKPDERKAGEMRDV